MRKLTALLLRLHGRQHLIEHGLHADHVAVHAQLLRWQNYPARAGVENRHSNELIATIAEDDIVI